MRLDWHFSRIDKREGAHHEVCPSCRGVHNMSLSINTLEVQTANVFSLLPHDLRKHSLKSSRNRIVMGPLRPLPADRDTASGAPIAEETLPWDAQDRVLRSVVGREMRVVDHYRSAYLDQWITLRWATTSRSAYDLLVRCGTSTLFVAQPNGTPWRPHWARSQPTFNVPAACNIVSAVRSVRSQRLEEVD